MLSSFCTEANIPHKLRNKTEGDLANPGFWKTAVKTEEEGNT